ncbi:ABC transporter ATP-binding protein [Pseudohoeflea coraliihabitans]|uniref:ABC transporter ATP-binding protein n=1 Tax=Pseudohoeflea coraliihabitans TaxID=2860393 RepID=A0ABS6WNG5_9HYPH|nr:ABC transporter ATP-binding protein [Pseudohoeflea sp. DP4N28-3]MBW3097203.1 ABC transporter ATP-binding protein [Pseudohoeflea sp. DP4N28-3]
MAKIELQEVGLRYENNDVLSNFSIEVEENEFLTLLGPSGCGKSTTLNLISGLLEPSYGEILIDGQVVNGVAPRHRQVAMVFQDYALYPHMNVFENLSFPLKAQKLGDQIIRSRVEDVCQTLGMAELTDRFPSDLSGGQRQRVALGRALVRDPRAFLMDEPLSNLDARLRVAMRAELKRLHNQVRTTIVYVTHDQAEAMTLSDRVAVLWDGKLQQIGTPREVYERPANQFVAGFVGGLGINLVPCTVESTGGDHFLSQGSFRIPISDRLAKKIETQSGREVAVGIRPEHIVVVEQEETGTQGVIEVLEYLGPETLVHLRVGTVPLIAKAPAHANWDIDTKVNFRIDKSRACIFSGKDERLIAVGIE